MSRITKALLALALLALALPAGAAADPKLVQIGAFDTPVHVTGPPGDPSRIFVVQRGGQVRLIKNGTIHTTPFLTVPGVRTAGSEQGMLSIAFPRDYGATGLFYVYLTSEPNGDIEVREYRRSANPDVADPASERLVWSTSHADAANHNGGQVAFGPDGKLWFATGDGGGSNNQFGHARDPNSRLGKLLRIDPRPGNAGQFTIPADNPVLPGAVAQSEIWAYGLRNPFRFSFDRVGGDLYIGDVGQSTREEVDRVLKAEGLGRGTDFEWPCREGFNDPAGGCEPATPHTPPIFDYETGAPRAITGGVRVRDPSLPTLRGLYLWADFYDGAIHALVPSRPQATADRDTGLHTPNLAAFGEDACGHVYVASYNGPVFRIEDGALGPCVPAAPTTPPGGGGAPITPPGGGGAPTTPPSGAGGGHAGTPDRTAPFIMLRMARKGRVGRRATPRILVTASENCRVTINARLVKTKLKRVRTPLRGGGRTTIRLRPRAGAAKTIRRALRRHKRVTMAVRVDAVDAAGNRSHLARRLKVRRG